MCQEIPVFNDKKYYFLSELLSYVSTEPWTHMQSDLQIGPSELHISPCHIWTHMQFVQPPMCLAT